MALGGPIWTGVLVHVFLLALAIEGWIGRIPRAFVAVPIVAYGGYYALYIYQTIDIARTSAELRKSNAAKVLNTTQISIRLSRRQRRRLLAAMRSPLPMKPTPISSRSNIYHSD